MTPERWQQIEELYRAARDAADRERVLAADPELRREVEALLAQEDHAGEPTMTVVGVGTQLGRYVIEAPLGKGGMGEVFRARDTRLGRSVAIKVSNSQFSERFEREARAISALNHPHICTLHDVGPNYLVMELVEGETLASRLKKGSLSLDQTLQYGAQIADALAAAHAKEITHRDLKPGNIMLSKSGVKVLDFGLAKMRSNPDEVLTKSNVVMGTPAYMAPEQLAGQEADERSDIYSLGLVLHEMATRKRAPQGQTPPLDQLPEQLAHVLARCLAEDPTARWQTAAEVRALLELRTKAPPHASPKWLWPVAAAVLLVIAVAAFVLLRPREATTAQQQPFRFQIPSPVSFPPPESFSVSPDGKQARPLPGTESTFVPLPIWSPDSRSIAFDSGARKLRRIDIAGGPPSVICDVPGTVAVGGSWNRDGDIIFGTVLPEDSGVMRVPATGGVPIRITAPPPGATDVLPSFLPDGRHFLFLRSEPRPDIEGGIYVGSLDVKPEAQDTHAIMKSSFNAEYVSTPGAGMGHILYVRRTTLMAHPFDLDRRALSGTPVALAPDVGNFRNNGFFSSSTGALVYRASARQEFQLRWFGRQGEALSAVGEQGRIAGPKLSPDGSRVAMMQANANNSDASDLWRMDLAQAIRIRLAEGVLNSYPNEVVWSPDGGRIAYVSKREGNWNLVAKPANGTGEENVLLRVGDGAKPTSWSNDGKFLLYTAIDDDPNIWALPLDGERKPSAVLRTPAAEDAAQFSPDGRWIAYTSNETGRLEIYVRAFPTAADTFRISRDGGTSPRWRAGELFYLSPGGKIMATQIRGNPSGAGTLQALFDAPSGQSGWDVSPDGKRFLFAVPVVQTTQTPFTVILNWQGELKK